MVLETSGLDKWTRIDCRSWASTMVKNGVINVYFWRGLRRYTNIFAYFDDVGKGSKLVTESANYGYPPRGTHLNLLLTVRR